MEINNKKTNAPAPISVSKETRNITQEDLLMNSSLAQSDADSLLKYKPIMYTICFIALALVMLTVIYYVISPLKSTVTPDDAAAVVPDKGYGGIMYVPGAQPGSDFISGKIMKSNASGDYKYRLMSADSKTTLYYLFSNNNDLSLSEGYTAEIKGSVAGKLNGVNVMNVQSIKLK